MYQKQQTASAVFNFETPARKFNSS